MTPTITADPAAAPLRPTVRFQTRRSGRARAVPAVWPAVVLFYCTLLPPEVHVDAGSLRIFAYRAFLLAMLPAIARRLSRGELRLGWVDFSITVSAAWFVLSMTVHYGFVDGLTNGGALFLDVFLAYFFARCYIADLRALRAVLKLGCWGILAAGVSMMLESVSGRLFVRPILGAITGGGTGESLVRAERLGLLRAYGPFPHPILAGLQMSSFVPLYLLIDRGRTSRLVGLIGAALCVFSLSSATFIGLFTNGMLVGYERLRRRMRELSWPLLTGFAAVVLAGIQLVSQNGVLSVIIRYLTLDPATGRYRMQIWTYGSQDVLQHPLWGVGRESWDRPSYMVSESIDAHYLWLAVRYGLPATIALLGAGIGAIVLLSRRVSAMPEGADRRALVGIEISLFTLLLLMFTVTLGSNSLVWFVMLMGVAVSIANSLAPPRVARPKRRPRPLPIRP